MNIYFLRHGQKIDDDKNLAESELTQEGFRQADLVGNRLKNYGIEHIYYSNMKRAIQTMWVFRDWARKEISIWRSDGKLRNYSRKA